MHEAGLSSDSANLNFLRSTAVLAVLAAHLTTMRVSSPHIWNLGHLGVLLFFVHTSLVLMLSLQRQDQKGSENRFIRFMLRRAFRIYPLSILSVLFYFFLKVPSRFVLGGLIPTHVSIAGLFSNLALTQNLTYSDSVPGVLWSLPLEIQMYLMLPLLYVIAVRRRPATMALIWIGAVILGTIQMNIGRLDRLNVLEYAPCFIPGVLAFCLGHRPRFKFWPLALIVAITAFMFAPKGAAIPKWLVCLTVGLMIPYFQEIRTRILTVPAEYIARYSFGIYLFHSAAIWFVFTQIPTTSLFLQITLSLFLTGAVSAAAFHLIEQPMIRVGTLVAQSVVSMKASPLKSKKTTSGA